MTRLIDADALKEHISTHRSVMCPVAGVLKDIDRIPTVDAEPVRHGKWIKFHDNGIAYQTCSECNYDMKVGGADSWCPACGAKMG